MVLFPVIMCLLAVCLLGLTAAAEAGKPLYAVEDVNEKWGYIDSEGSLVIPFTFSYAEDFRGDYALVRQFPEDMVTYEEYGFYGIIDQTGAFVLPAEYYDINSVEDAGDYCGGINDGFYYIRDGWKSGSKCGFFDIPSGFFSGLIYDGVTVLWGTVQDPELIGVTMEGKTGFARRQTGEIVIPCQYSSEYQYDFSGDYCRVMPIDSPVADGWILIDRTGREIPMPENCYVAWDGNFADGLAAVWNAETDLYGYIDTEGKPVIGQQYQMAYGFSEGLACVQLISGEWAMIDTEGSIVIRRSDVPNSNGSSPYCRHGLIRCGMPNDSAMVYYNKNGREAFRLEIEGLIGFTDFKENGVAFYAVDAEHLPGFDPDADICGEGVGLFNDRGEILTPPVFFVEDREVNKEFSEGLFAITEVSTLLEGYIDERGEWAFPPVDGYCYDFRDGLAPIHMQSDELSEMVFVDREGKILYRYTYWFAEDEE